MTIDRNSDYHMHTTFSDGAAGVDEMAQAAIQKGLSRITITDHMPLPFDMRYAMEKERIDEYRRAVRAAQEKYAGRLDINMGIEIEYIPQHRFWIHSILKMGWDVSIVSVHTLIIDNTPHMVNGSKTEFEKLMSAVNYDIRTLYTLYFKILQAALKTGWFDIAGHLDVMKKHLGFQHSMNEQRLSYQALVEDTLDIIRDRNMKMEINLSGLDHPAKETYPGTWIVKKAVNKGIGVVLSSDAHCPEDIARGFEHYYLSPRLLPAGEYRPFAPTTA